MKAKELIELLKQQDPDAVVVTWCNDQIRYYELNEPEAILLGDKSYGCFYDSPYGGDIEGKTKAVKL